MKLDLFKYSTQKACDIIESLEHASKHGDFSCKVKFSQVGIGLRTWEIRCRVKDPQKLADLRYKLESYLWTLGVSSDHLID